MMVTRRCSTQNPIKHPEFHMVVQRADVLNNQRGHVAEARLGMRNAKYKLELLLSHNKLQILEKEEEKRNQEHFTKYTGDHCALEMG